jgi:RNA polymerase sigma-54 factor
VTAPGILLGAKQQLAVSPRLQQAVRLLQMSALEFTQELQEALANNPFLEEPEAAESEGAAPGEVRTDAAAVEEPAFDGADVVVEELPSEAAAEDPFANADLPGRTVGERGGDLEPYDWVSEKPGLRDLLREQVCGQSLSPRERLVAALVIETLDDDGYLRGDVTETAAALPQPLDPPLGEDEIQAAVRIVQNFEPLGVAARSLQECLLLQLDALPDETRELELARRLVRGHLELLARHDYPALQRRLDCGDGSLRQAHALIRTLDPRPGQRYAQVESDYVVPDVIVRPVKGKLTAVVNPAVLPRARLNRGYIELFRRARDSGGNPALQQQLQEARWLLRNAEQRFVTIKRVADAIVARQRAFFAYGEIALKPLVLRAVADELGLHESTVSRATGNKYMATPRGLFEFKHFFSRQLATGTGGTCSATAVRALIKEMIEAENPEDPLSDVVLAQRLTAQGIQVARRTVAKYRTQLKLPPAELRRRVTA